MDKCKKGWINGYMWWIMNEFKRNIWVKLRIKLILVGLGGLNLKRIRWKL